MKQAQLSSLSIFFPFFNDAGTVLPAIKAAYQVGSQVTHRLEVIALHGGNSHDATWRRIKYAQKKFPDLKVINQKHNQIGYAVIKVGLAAASKAWVFYTDGDLQYDVKDLLQLVKVQKQTKAKVINGYKLQRGDNQLRYILGNSYAWLSKKIFGLPIRDTDCDFRLIHRRLLKRIQLRQTHASILPELIWQLQYQGAKFAEVPVHHRPRRYGQSNYRLRQLIKEKVLGDATLFWRITASRWGLSLR